MTVLPALEPDFVVRAEEVPEISAIVAPAPRTGDRQQELCFEPLEAPKALAGC